MTYTRKELEAALIYYGPPRDGQGVHFTTLLEAAKDRLDAIPLPPEPREWVIIGRNTSGEHSSLYVPGAPWLASGSHMLTEQEAHIKHRDLSTAYPNHIYVMVHMARPSYQFTVTGAKG